MKVGQRKKSNIRAFTIVLLVVLGVLFLYATRGLAYARKLEVMVPVAAYGPIWLMRINMQ